MKSQSALILLLLLSKSQPLALGCDLGLGADLEGVLETVYSFQKEGQTFGLSFFLGSVTRRVAVPIGLKYSAEALDRK